MLIAGGLRIFRLTQASLSLPRAQSLPLAIGSPIACAQMNLDVLPASCYGQQSF